MIAYRLPKSNARRRGQALVEMALVVTVLLGLALGLIQFALIANARITLTNLAREGARNAALHAMEPNADTITKNYVDGVANLTSLSSISTTDVTVSAPTRAPGNPITVTVNYDMRNKFILPVSFPGLSRFGTNTSASAVMVIQNP